MIAWSLSGVGFIGNQLTLAGSNVTTDGANTALEHLCLGAAFSAGSCGGAGTDAFLSGFDLGLFGQQLTDSQSFVPRVLLGAILDITVDGGTFGGAASLTSVTSQFTQQVPSVVPEPATLTLVAFGLGAVIRRQRLRNQRSPSR